RGQHDPRLGDRHSRSDLAAHRANQDRGGPLSRLAHIGVGAVSVAADDGCPADNLRAEIAVQIHPCADRKVGPDFGADGFQNACIGLESGRRGKGAMQEDQETVDLALQGSKAFDDLRGVLHPGGITRGGRRSGAHRDNAFDLDTFGIADLDESADHRIGAAEAFDHVIAATRAELEIRNVSLFRQEGDGFELESGDGNAHVPVPQADIPPIIRHADVPRSTARGWTRSGPADKQEVLTTTGERGWRCTRLFTASPRARLSSRTWSAATPASATTPIACTICRMPASRCWSATTSAPCGPRLPGTRWRKERRRCGATGN